jgi:pimeloyl-ACP methyl ester carboxylesterase
MNKVLSQDKTPIAYEVSGRGEPLVFVVGAFNDHTRCAPLAAALAGDFTVVTYDRRARGESGDTPPYAIDREVEDLAAVLEVTGGRAAVFGYSSGALLAVRAAAAGLPISRLILFEGPFRQPATDLPARLEALVRAGRPGDAVELFQTEGVGLPPAVVAGLKRSPMWPALAAMAQSVVYDATITSEASTPAPVGTPALVLTGAGTWPLLRAAAAEATRLLPNARHEEVAGGEDHDIPVPQTAAAIRAFLGS